LFRFLIVRSPKHGTSFNSSQLTKMVIMTEGGKRNISDDPILCMDRPQSVGEHLVITLYLLTGERILGVVEHREPQSEQTSLEVH
jgi:hypothetical protein